MKKYGFIFMLAVIIIAFQQAVFSRITIFGVGFDIVFIFVICYSLLRDDVESIIVALFCGIVRDCFYPSLFGINSIVFVLSAFILSQIQKRIFRDAVIIPMFFTFVFTVLKTLIYFSYFYITSIKYDFTGHVVDVLLLESLYNSIICIFMYRFIKNILSMKIMDEKWKF